jgi:hypothetical protein
MGALDGVISGARIIAWLFPVALTGACGLLTPCLHPDRPRAPQQTGLDEGIWGQVTFWEGDFMAGEGCKTGSIRGAEREIIIYPEIDFDAFIELTRSLGEELGFVDQVALEEAFLVSPVDSVRSESDGFFEVRVTPGVYGLLVREAGKLYAQPGWLDVAVSDEEAIRVELEIKYAASF